MHTTEHVDRREFLKATGGSLGLLVAGATGQSAFAGAAENGARSIQRDPAQLQRLLNAMEAKGGQFWSVPRQDGEFLHFLVKVARARSVLEVGTSHGYSAIWMGLALEETGGRLTTIEIDAVRHDLARRNVAQAGLSQRVALIQGNAHIEVPKLDGPFDLVFLDAE